MKLDAKKLFLALVIGNALLVGATLGVFMVASSAAQKKSQTIAQLKADDQTNQQALNYYKVLQSNLNANKDLAAIADKVLPTDKDQSAAFADLDKISKSTGVPIGQITFNPGTNKGTGQTLTSPSGIKGVSVISVALSSTTTPYNNLLNFLKAIENTQRRMQITSLNITPNSTNPNLLDRVDLSIDIYLKAETK
jgi:Tfp pilus assembly protein PilO